MSNELMIPVHFVPPTHEEIALNAYYRWEKKGYPAGETEAVAIWLESQSILIEERILNGDINLLKSELKAVEEIV